MSEVPSQTSRQVELRAAAAAAVGSILVGFVPFMISGLQQSGIDTVSLLLGRYLVALCVLIPLAIWTSPGLGREWSQAGRWLFLNGLTLGAFQTWCYFKAIETVASSVVVTIFYCYPVMALLFDRFLFGHAVRRSTIGALALVLVGVVMTSAPGLVGARLDPTGLLFAALTPVGYAVYIAVAYPFTRKTSPFAGAAFIYASLATCFGIIAVWQGVQLPRDAGQWATLIAIGTLGGAVQIASFAYALPRLSSSGYALIVCLELVTVVLAGVALLGERLLPLQWLGIALVLGGIIVERWMKSRG